MKVLFLSLICLVVFANVAVAQSEIKLKIGAKLPREYVKESQGQMATHPNQFRPFIRKTIADVNYIIAFDEENRKIRWIYTMDEDFCTAKGLCVGSKIKVTRDQLKIYPTWYIYAPITSDGWLPVVGSSLLDGFDENSENSLSNLKNGEIRTVEISGFQKGGN